MTEKDEGEVRTANLKIKIHTRLMRLKIAKGGVSISDLVEELLDFYEGGK